MSYGVLQEYYFDNWALKGSRKITGIIGTTSNGVMYLSMPLLFALFTKRWARYRQKAAIFGALLACTGFILSSFSKHVWHLVATQGVLAALGCALVYSPITLSLGEWLVTLLHELYMRRLLTSYTNVQVQYQKSYLQPSCSLWHLPVHEKHRGISLSVHIPTSSRPLRLSNHLTRLGRCHSWNRCSLHLDDTNTSSKLQHKRYYSRAKDSVALSQISDILGLQYRNSASKRWLRYPTNIHQRICTQCIQPVSYLLDAPYHSDQYTRHLLLHFLWLFERQ
jgi:hypothetical protein